MSVFDGNSNSINVGMDIEQLKSLVSDGMIKPVKMNLKEEKKESKDVAKDLNKVIENFDDVIENAERIVNSAKKAYRKSSEKDTMKLLSKLGKSGNLDLDILKSIQKKLSYREESATSRFRQSLLGQDKTIYNKEGNRTGTKSGVLEGHFGFKGDFATKAGDAIKSITEGISLDAVFKNTLKGPFDYMQSMRKIAYQTEGIIGTTEELQKPWDKVQESAERTGVDRIELEKALMVASKKGMKSREQSTKVSVAGLFVSKQIGSSAEQTAELFNDWHMSLGMSADTMESMTGSMRSIARSTGVTGDALIGAAKSTEQILTNMRNTSMLTAKSAEAMIQMSAQAKKAGVTTEVQRFQVAFSAGSQLNFINKADQFVQTMMAQAAVNTRNDGGGPEISLKKAVTTSIKSPEEMKRLQQGLMKVASEMASSITENDDRTKALGKIDLNTFDFESLPGDIQEAINARLAARDPTGQMIGMNQFITAINALNVPTLAEQLKKLADEEKKTGITSQEKMVIEVKRDDLLTKEASDALNEFNKQITNSKSLGDVLKSGGTIEKYINENRMGIEAALKLQPGGSQGMDSAKIMQELAQVKFESTKRLAAKSGDKIQIDPIQFNNLIKSNNPADIREGLAMVENEYKRVSAGTEAGTDSTSKALYSLKVANDKIATQVAGILVWLDNNVKGILDVLNNIFGKWGVFLAILGVAASGTIISLLGGLLAGIGNVGIAAAAAVRSLLLGGAVPAAAVGVAEVGVGAGAAGAAGIGLKAEAKAASMAVKTEANIAATAVKSEAGMLKVASKLKTAGKIGLAIGAGALLWNYFSKKDNNKDDEVELLQGNPLDIISTTIQKIYKWLKDCGCGVGGGQPGGGQPQPASTQRKWIGPTAIVAGVATAGVAATVAAKVVIAANKLNAVAKAEMEAKRLADAVNVVRKPGFLSKASSFLDSSKSLIYRKLIKPFKDSIFTPIAKKLKPVSDYFIEAKASVLGKGKKTLDAGRNFLKPFTNFMGEKFAAVKTFFGKNFITTFNNVVGWVGKKWENFITPVKGFFSNVLKKGSGVIDYFAATFNNVVGWVGKKWENFITPVKGFFSNVLKKGSGVIDYFAAKLAPTLLKLEPIIAPVIRTAQEVFRPIATVFSKLKPIAGKILKHGGPVLGAGLSVWEYFEEKDAYIKAGGDIKNFKPKRGFWESLVLGAVTGSRDTSSILSPYLGIEKNTVADRQLGMLGSAATGFLQAGPLGFVAAVWTELYKQATDDVIYVPVTEGEKQKFGAGESQRIVGNMADQVQFAVNKGDKERADTEIGLLEEQLQNSLKKVKIMDDQYAKGYHLPWNKNGATSERNIEADESNRIQTLLNRAILARQRGFGGEGVYGNDNSEGGGGDFGGVNTTPFNGDVATALETAVSVLPKTLISNVVEENMRREQIGAEPDLTQVTSDELSSIAKDSMNLNLLQDILDVLKAKNDEDTSYMPGLTGQGETMTPPTHTHKPASPADYHRLTGGSFSQGPSRQVVNSSWGN